ncbi:MAG: cupin domain-containing protein, partial [Burkholderiaceae bacterium]|nr:cupin domain-containing protein [Burkholderiaceae bacterium]
MSNAAQQSSEPRSWDQPEGASFGQWMESRVARFSTRKYDFDALKFQADF